MQKWLLIGFVAVFATACWVLWLWNELASAPGGDATTTPPAAPAAVATAPLPAPEPGAAREAPPAPAIAAPTAEAPFDPSPVAVPPWLARFLVTDEDERPIADATVTIWRVPRVRFDPALQARTGKSVGYSTEHDPDALFELRTDATGRATATLALECVAAGAAKAGVKSGQRLLDHQRDGAGETRFVLEATVLLHGKVVRADGAPAAGARVTTLVNGTTEFSRQYPPQPEIVVADATGCFAVPVVMHGGYDLVAELGKERSFREHCWIEKNAVPEVVLVFPGAITLNGTVVDADGAPVDRARVTAWREFRFGDPTQASDDYERTGTKTAADGSFSIPVRKHRRYQMLATADGHATSEAVWVEPTAARPRVDVRLVLQRFTTIGGTVRHADGSPFPAVRVSARIHAPHDHGTATPSSANLYQDCQSVVSDTNGRFSLTVHPGTTWTVSAWPIQGDLFVSVAIDPVQPGTQDLEIVIRDEELQGCVVRGEVIPPAGARLPAGFEVDVVSDTAGRRFWHGSPSGRCDDNHFELPPLPIGKQFSLVVFPLDARKRRVIPRDPGPFAPCRVGPFTATREGLDLQVRLEPWGELPLRVLTADGTPARSVLVKAYCEPRIDIHDPQGWIDADGGVCLKHCMPGATRLRLLREALPAHELELVVQPGLNPEQVVRLPPAGAGNSGR